MRPEDESQDHSETQIADNNQTRSQRRRVLKRLKISFGNEFCSIDVILKNVSETGALLELDHGYIPPDEFVLHNDLDGYKVPCKVVRRQGNKLGVICWATAKN